jgi:hypothetical protein
LVLPVPQISRLPLLGREHEVEAAYDAWGANCGPLAIAAATDRSLDEVRSALTMGSGRFKGYTTVPDVQTALRWLDVQVERTWSKRPASLLTDLRSTTIAMIQWGGPWMRDARAAARHRHLIAIRYGWIGPKLGPTWVADVNLPDIWCLLGAWTEVVPAMLRPKGGDGTWSVGWACQLREAKAEST